MTMKQDIKTNRETQPGPDGHNETQVEEIMVTQVNERPRGNAKVILYLQHWQMNNIGSLYVIF